MILSIRHVKLCSNTTWTQNLRTTTEFTCVFHSMIQCAFSSHKWLEKVELTAPHYLWSHILFLCVIMFMYSITCLIKFDEFLFSTHGRDFSLILYGVLIHWFCFRVYYLLTKQNLCRSLSDFYQFVFSLNKCSNIHYKRSILKLE